MAACGAVDEGATVAVVEMQPWSSYVDLDGSGTNMAGWYGEDIGHVNSQFLIERGFGPFNTGEITAEFCKRAGGRVNPDIIRSFVQNSGAMVDRYKEIYDSYEEERKANDSAVFMKGTQVVIPDVDVPDEGTFDMSNMFEYPLCNTQAAWSGANVSYPIECGGYKTWPCNIQFYGYQGNNIEYVHKYIVQHTQENGAEWFFEHTGVVLEAERLRRRDRPHRGRPRRLRALQRLEGRRAGSGRLHRRPGHVLGAVERGHGMGRAFRHDQGRMGADGLSHRHRPQDGCWAGGMIEPTPRGWMGLGGGADGPWGVAPLLMLNVNGKRFMNEGAIAQYQPTCMRQPAGLACWVTDANWKSIIGKSPLDHGGPNFGMDDYMERLEADMAAVEVGNPEGSQGHSGETGRAQDDAGHRVRREHA